MSGSDGRNIDADLGTLAGEASHQRAAAEQALVPVSKTSPSEQWGLTTGDPTYYDRPVIKKSPWTWDVPAYYYVGGASGAAMVLGAAATLLNRQGLTNLVMQSRWIGTAGSLLSSYLLIHDLGRPERFFHMLRVFRPTSPMSVGTYILSAFGSFTGLSAMLQFAPRTLRPIADVSAVLGGVFGLGLASYTGVLVSHTVVPVWQRPHRIMPILFLASGTASASALFDLLNTTYKEHRAVAVFGLVGKVAELAAIAALEREVGTVPEAVRPLREGVSGILWNAAKILTGVSLALTFIPKPSRRTRVLTGILGTAGALCLRFGIHYAGQASALNPRATFHQQRAGQGAFEVTARLAVTGPD